MAFQRPIQSTDESNNAFFNRTLEAIEKYIEKVMPSVADQRVIDVLFAETGLMPEISFATYERRAKLLNRYNALVNRAISCDEPEETRTVDRGEDQSAHDRFERSMIAARAAAQARDKAENRLVDVLLKLGRNSASDKDTLIAVAGEMFHD